MRSMFLMLSLLLPVTLLGSSASLAQSKLDASILSYDGKDFVRTETTFSGNDARVGPAHNCIEFALEWAVRWPPTFTLWPRRNNVRFGSLADIRERIRDVRFASERGHSLRPFPSAKCQ